MVHEAREYARVKKNHLQGISQLSGIVPEGRFMVRRWGCVRSFLGGQRLQGVIDRLNEIDKGGGLTHTWQGIEVEL